MRNKLYMTIDELIKDRAYTRPECYIGQTYEGYIELIAQTRDSDILCRSNFEVASDMLDISNCDDESVINAGASHWAWGWVEVIYVSINAPEKLKIAMDILNALDNYPVLDDSHYSEMESEEYYEYADQVKDDVAEFLVDLFGLPEELKTDADFLSVCTDLNVECQYYSGPDSALKSHGDDMDGRDLDQYISCIEQLSYNSYHAENEAFKLIAACFGVNKAA